MWIKKNDHTWLQLIYRAFYRRDFHKLSLTQPSTCFKKHGRAFQTIDRAFEALKENQKPGQEFEKLG